MESQLSNKALIDLGLQLAETRWKRIVDHPEHTPVTDDWRRAILAWCLENQAQSLRARFGLRSFQEITTNANVPTFDRYSFGIIRSILPQIAALDLVSVQPMNGPVGVVFYLDYVRGTAKGSSAAGSKLFETNNPYYASDIIDTESIGNTGAGQTTQYQGVLGWTPVRPGSVRITTTDPSGNAIVVTDNGNGSLVEGVTTIGTISYSGGSYEFALVTTPAVSVAVTVSYRYNLENNGRIPEVDLVLNSSPAVSETVALRTRWSLNAETDLRMVYGLSADSELLNATKHELRVETDQRLTARIREISIDASASPYSYLPWNRRTPAGVSWAEHKRSFMDHIVAVDSVIYQGTNRAVGNRLICGQNVGNLMQTLEGFVPSGFVQARGVYRLGQIQRWGVYLDPAFDANEFVVGYKGTSELEAGLFWLPYVLFESTPAITLDDRVRRQGIASRYAIKTIRPEFYVRSSIVDEEYS